MKKNLQILYLVTLIEVCIGGILEAQEFDL